MNEIKYHLSRVPSVTDVLIKEDAIKLRLLNKDEILINFEAEDNIALEGVVRDLLGILNRFKDVSAEELELFWWFHRAQHPGFINCYEEDLKVFHVLTDTYHTRTISLEEMSKARKHAHLYPMGADICLHGNVIYPTGGAMKPAIPYPASVSQSHATTSHSMEIMDFSKMGDHKRKRNELGKYYKLPERSMEEIEKCTKFFLNSVPCYRRFIHDESANGYWEYRLFEDDPNTSVVNIPMSDSSEANHKRTLIEQIRNIVNENPVILTMAPTTRDEK